MCEYLLASVMVHEDVYPPKPEFKGFWLEKFNNQEW